MDSKRYNPAVYRNLSAQETKTLACFIEPWVGPGS